VIIFLEADASPMELGRELNADVAEMPRLVVNAGYVGLIGGIAQYEAVFIAVVAQPNALFGEAEAVIAVGMADAGYIYREPRDVLGSVARHGADGMMMRIGAVIRILREPLIPHLPLETHGAVGVVQPVSAAHALNIGGDEHLAELHRDLDLNEGGVELGIADIAQKGARVYEIVRDVPIRQTVFEIDEARLLPFGEIAALGHGIGRGRDYGGTCGPRSGA
jgi:hypothetical protein